MKVRVDSDLCSACGLCWDTYPDLFKEGDDGLSQVKGEEVPSGLEQAAREAAEDCAMEAIIIEE